MAAYEQLKNLPAEHQQAIWGAQPFYRVFSTVNGGRVRETDLFEGIPDDDRHYASGGARHGRRDISITRHQLVDQLAECLAAVPSGRSRPPRRHRRFAQRSI